MINNKSRDFRGKWLEWGKMEGVLGCLGNGDK